MPVWYSPAKEEDHELLARVIEKWHPDLMEAYPTPDRQYDDPAEDFATLARNAAARIGLVMAHPDPESDKPAMLAKGIRILAKIKANSEADRVAGAPDATITLDAAHWKEMAEDEVDGYRQAFALLDHELYHLEVRREKDSKRILTDDAGRPKFRMRPHDWEITGFRAVAERNKQHAAEVIVARRFRDEYGNLLFSFGEEFAVQRDLEFAKEVLGMTEAAVAEINADHERLGMPRPFVNGPTRIVDPRSIADRVTEQVVDQINAGAAGPGVTAELRRHCRRAMPQGPITILESGPVEEISEDLFAEATP